MTASQEQEADVSTSSPPSTDSFSDSSTISEKFHDYSTIKHHLTWLYEIKDPILRQRQKEFHAKRNGSIGFMYYVNVIQTLLGIPTMLVSMYCDFLQPVQDQILDSHNFTMFCIRRITGIFTFIGLTISCLALWYIIFSRNSNKKETNSMFLFQPLKNLLDLPNDESSSKKSSLWTASNIYFMFGQAYFTVLYVRKVFRCFVPSFTPDYLACFVAESLLHNSIVDPYLMIIVPLLNFVLVTDVSFSVFWISYGINLFVLLFLETYVSKYEAVARLVITIFLCIFFVIDLQIRNAVIFFTAMDLNNALKEVKRMEEEYRKNEMRTMIANVAHDMKTVRPLNNRHHELCLVFNLFDSLIYSRWPLL